MGRGKRKRSSFATIHTRGKDTPFLLCGDVEERKDTFLRESTVVYLIWVQAPPGGEKGKKKGKFRLKTCTAAFTGGRGKKTKSKGSNQKTYLRPGDVTRPQTL